MRVLVIIKATKASEAGQMPTTELLTAMGNFNEELVEAGVMLAGEGLHPSAKGKRVRFTGKDRTVTDGPFPETKDLVSGFWIWQVKSMDDAVSWVKRAPFPTDEDCDVEIRPAFEAADFGDAMTPEVHAQEDRMRAELAAKKALRPSASGRAERVQHQAVRPERERRVVARSFVAQKGVLRVHLVPRERRTGLAEARADLEASRLGDMRILTAPDQRQLALDLPGPLERIVTLLAQRALLQIRGVKADGAEDARVEGRAKSEVSADADAHGEERPRDVLAPLQMVEHGARVVVVGRDRFGRLVMVPGVRPGLIIGEHRPCRLELVKDLRHRHDEAMPGEQRRQTVDGAGALKDLREQDHAGVARLADGAVDVGSHRAGGRREIGGGLIEDHGVAA